jgi:hypothetical protein
MITKMNKFISLVVMLGLIFIIQSCYKEVVSHPNPFDENINNQDTVKFEFEEIDPNSIAGLYLNIFAPTCANSGCHDGTFEPDFRSVESSYYSMVYKKPVKNNGTLTFRVDPRNPDQSAILKRLDGSIQPEMPIEIEPDSDWWEKSDQYIQNVRTWIENGALDLSGNAPNLDYLNPSILGVMAFSNGEPLPRKDTYGAIQIPSEVRNIEIYIGFDPINMPENFTINEIMLSAFHTDFKVDTTLVMEIMDASVPEYGLYGELIDFTHKVEINLDSMLLSEDHYYMRVRVQQGTNPVAEIPTNNGLQYIKEYMSFTISD